MSELENEMAKGIVDVVGDLVRPTSKVIGDNLGLLVDSVMGWLGYVGEKQKIKREIYLEEYKKRITTKVAAIPEENLQEPSLRVVGPAIEASKYFIEENELREMFASLIASACDSRKAGNVHPSFIECIKQMTPLEAKFMAAFTENPTYPAVRLEAIYNDGTGAQYPMLLLDLKNVMPDFSNSEQIQLTEAIENLNRLGLVEVNSKFLELNYDYNAFQSHGYYSAVSKLFREGSTPEMKEYRIECTILGQNFVKCCISDKKNKEQ